MRRRRPFARARQGHPLRAARGASVARRDTAELECVHLYGNNHECKRPTVPSYCRGQPLDTTHAARQQCKVRIVAGHGMKFGNYFRPEFNHIAVYCFFLSLKPFSCLINRNSGRWWVRCSDSNVIRPIRFTFRTAKTMLRILQFKRAHSR